MKRTPNEKKKKTQNDFYFNYLSFLYQKYNNFKFIHSFIAGKRPHRKPDTQILGDYGVEEWRDGGNVEMDFSVLLFY